ncbi:histidine phosphatase family protein [Bradyrhizobium sp. STM 3809]|uniref:histidine phosphatase family protein n=1 Tax=Bradyrhizobium sp. STM 3809 TaxID=551936 RepID=UPI0002405AD4|nr:histidine phosphatase family protein [Bradyrhizobium sp. STM 3809]CCD99403.1 putative phosphoglycerate mutase family protein [Bradyrhizobium sp. STM 3809]
MTSDGSKPSVVTTRWWWVRHAPVRSDGGNIYGQSDIACDTGDREVFEAVAKILPRSAVWYASNLMRTHQTAEAIWAAGFPQPPMMTKEAAFAEQHLGQWQGMNRAAFLASRPAGSNWFAAIDEPAPGGESYMDLYTRVTAAIARITVAEAGRDVIAVGHGGTIKAAVGLALGGLVEKGLAFDIDNCSVTRLDHIAAGETSTWRLPMVNQQPWIADAAHRAMHQPAGPEVTTSKLA